MKIIGAKSRVTLESSCIETRELAYAFSETTAAETEASRSGSSLVAVAKVSRFLVQAGGVKRASSCLLRKRFMMGVCF